MEYPKSKKKQTSFSDTNHGGYKKKKPKAQESPSSSSSASSSRSPSSRSSQEKDSPERSEGGAVGMTSRRIGSRQYANEQARDKARKYNK